MVVVTPGRTEAVEYVVVVAAPIRTLSGNGPEVARSHLVPVNRMKPARRTTKMTRYQRSACLACGRHECQDTEHGHRGLEYAPSCWRRRTSLRSRCQQCSSSGARNVRVSRTGTERFTKSLTQFAYGQVPRGLGTKRRVPVFSRSIVDPFVERLPRVKAKIALKGNGGFRNTGGGSVWQCLHRAASDLRQSRRQPHHRLHRNRGQVLNG